MEKLTIEEVRVAGYTRGRNIASGTSLYAAAESVAETSYFLDTVRVGVEDHMKSVAYECEENNRSFSPFEFTAARLNADENADDLWAAFDDGISKGINDEIEARLNNLDDDYIFGLVEDAAARIERREARRSGSAPQLHVVR